MMCGSSKGNRGTVTRRGFMATAAASGAAAAGVTRCGNADEGERDVVEHVLRCEAPTIRRVDVLVCGGGPAGCAAAAYAARAGAKTMLIESLPFLGGVWTAVGVSHLMQGSGRDGFNAEIHHRLPVNQVFGRNIYVIEDMKHLLDKLMAEAGVETQFHTRAVAVSNEDAGVQGVFTVSKSGFEFIEAGVVIDTTGDGDVAAAAGCEYRMGREFDGKTQPVTLFGTIGGYRGQPAKGRALVEILEKGGWRPSYPPVTLFPQPGQPGVFRLMATQFYGVDGTNARDLSQAEIQGRAEIRKCVEVFQAQGGNDWKDVFLIQTGPAIGVRETRRIRGRYYLTWEDLERGASFEDGVTRITSGSNIHPVDNPYKDPPTDLPPRPDFRVRPYEIPYRCLVAADVNNLLMAGRCISGDCYALGSYRLTGNVVRTGEAAGLAAALATRRRILPAELDGMDLVRRLKEMRSGTA
ncbi:MAG: FAD-dependent oxidoreductase [Planctomycetota bacterium]